MGERLVTVIEQSNIEVFDVIPDIQTPDEAANMDIALDAPELEMNVENPQPQSFAEIVAAVEVYFGGQIFTYKNYRGTITDFAEKCPMGKVVFGQGVEAAIAFINKFNETLPDEPKKEDNPEQKQDEPKTVDETDKSEKTSEQTDYGTSDKQETMEIKTDREVATSFLAKVAVNMTKKNTEISSKQTPKQSTAAETSDIAEREEIIVVPEVVEPAPLPASPAIIEQTESQQKTVEEIEIIDINNEIIAPSVETEPVVTETPVYKDLIENDERTHKSKIEVIETIEIAEDEMDIPIEEPEILTSQVSQVEVVQSEMIEDDATSPVIERIELVEPFADSVHEETNESDEYDSFTDNIDVIDEPEEQDELYDSIANRLGFEPNKDVATEHELIDDSDTELERTFDNALSMFIKEAAETTPENQPTTERQLVEIVRGIEILKRARSAEECRDALDNLKKNLIIYYESQGDQNPERTAAELLSNYDLQLIDETVNQALKLARSRRMHPRILAQIRMHLIGRHVVSLLFTNIYINERSTA